MNALVDGVRTLEEPGRCQFCGRGSSHGQEHCHVPRALAVCPTCVHQGTPEVRAHLQDVHRATRLEFDLPPEPPRNAEGIPCVGCSNACIIGEGQHGFCGLRSVRKGKLVRLAGTARRGLLHWYRDPLPTNCVADWVCEGHHHPGDHNLAVFYSSCTANCLSCQNWHFREVSLATGETISARDLAAAANEHTYCACFFGGDPASQMPHALSTARHLARRGVRVCWETNGMMSPEALDRAVQQALDTGGCIKFDLKAWDEQTNLALAGVSNQRVLENLARAAQRHAERPVPPLVVASTLLVPGYVDAEQVAGIAGYLVSLDPRIPYALLGFAPHFYLADLPYTSVEEALEAERVARAAGLSNVHIGNRHLLGWIH